VDGGFNFGQPAKRPAKLGGPRARRSGGTFDIRMVWVAAGLAVAAVLAFVFLRGAGEAGEQVADARSDTIAQVDRAQDVAAQASIGRALSVAGTIHAERGTFAIDPADLSAFDPSIHFTSGASTGPTSIAYHTTASAFGVAVRSGSGTCWWARSEGSGTTAYGSGGTCTGQAALAASDPSW
jgi:hypothetical protein